VLGEPSAEHRRRHRAINLGWEAAQEYLRPGVRYSELASAVAAVVRREGIPDFREPLVQVPAGTSILPEDARDYLRPIEALPAESRRCLLPRALVAGLQRFAVTHGVQDASGAIRETCVTEGERLDSELSMIRYIAWAIPAIGFIGTVRGIGMALSEAYRAVEGDIAGVTDALGVAFNSTLVALILSIIIMFLMHQIQLQQERLALDAQSFCEGRLLPHLKVAREMRA
jgi:biopolymer transport protein ExbB/TolQ